MDEPLSFFITVGAHESTPLDFTKTPARRLGPVPPVNSNVRKPRISLAEPSIQSISQLVKRESSSPLPVLEVIPNEGPGGKVTGTYGLLQIQNGDSFHTTIACADNQPDCALKFELQYDSGEHNM